MGRVVVAMDPHKRSATIEVMDADETVLGGDRFDTDSKGYAAMKSYVERWPDRVWAIEGCNGIVGESRNCRLGRYPWTRSVAGSVYVPRGSARSS